MVTYAEIFKLALKRTGGNFREAHNLTHSVLNKIETGNWEIIEPKGKKSTLRERLEIDSHSFYYINSLENRIGFQVVKKGINGQPWGYSNARYGKINEEILEIMIQEAILNSQMGNYTGWDLRTDIGTEFEDSEFEIILYYFKEDDFTRWLEEKY